METSLLLGSKRVLDEDDEIPVNIDKKEEAVVKQELNNIKRTSSVGYNRPDDIFSPTNVQNSNKPGFGTSRSILKPSTLLTDPDANTETDPPSVTLGNNASKTVKLKPPVLANPFVNCDFKTKSESEANGDYKFDELSQSENNSSSKVSISSGPQFVPLSDPSISSVNLAKTTSATNSEVPVVSNSAASSTTSSTKFVFDEKIMNTAAGKELLLLKDVQKLDSILIEYALKNTQTKFADNQTEKQLDPLPITIKLRNILEGMESLCKPDEINTEDWEELSTNVRWKQLLSSPKNHSWVENFMKCADKSTLEELNCLIKHLFVICKEIQKDFFRGKPVNFDKLLCEDLKKPLNFLNDVGLEITFGSRSLTEMLEEIVMYTTDSQDDKVSAEKIKNENVDSATIRQESEDQQVERNSGGISEFPNNCVVLKDSSKKKKKNKKSKKNSDCKH